jgi:pyruvate,water dikinase
MVVSSSYIRWFETIRLEDVSSVGGKNASLGELYRELGEVGVRVPNGFALTVAAYADALSSAKAWGPLHELLDGLDIADVTLLAARAAKAHQIV